jgi:cell cycle sensor histidine kinase DivJ
MDRPTYLTALAAANADGRSTTIEIRMRHDDPAQSTPRYAWIEIALSPVIDGEGPGERYEAVALLRNVTQRRDEDDEMRRARKMAEDASIAKSRFLATIGHELRTPLNAIVGFSEMMTSGVVGELSPTHREYASLIHKSGTHLIEVVSMLLDMSRIEAGRFELQTESFAPQALVDPCLQIVEPMARERNVKLNAQVSPSLPALVADERACRQILINLLSNAIKFSHRNATVTLTMKRQGQSLNISVSDSGIGMGQDDIERLGEPFFQAHAGLARGYEGTGLGLSIVKGLVELHQGTLHATSRLGEGTVMTVLLPVNGPETKLDETGNVTPLRETTRQQMPEWHDGRRKAQ